MHLLLKIAVIASALIVDAIIVYDMVTTLLRKLGWARRRGLFTRLGGWLFQKIFGYRHDDFGELR